MCLLPDKLDEYKSLLFQNSDGKVVVEGFHKCVSNYFYNIPLQSCGNICGVIVTNMDAIGCIGPTLWRFGFLAIKSALPKGISWFKCPTSHACYL